MTKRKKKRNKEKSDKEKEKTEEKCQSKSRNWKRKAFACIQTRTHTLTVLWLGLQSSENFQIWAQLMAQSTHWHVGYNSMGQGFLCVCDYSVSMFWRFACDKKCVLLSQQKAVKLLNLLDKHSGWLLMAEVFPHMCTCAHTRTHMHTRAHTYTHWYAHIQAPEIMTDLAMIQMWYETWCLSAREVLVCVATQVQIRTYWISASLCVFHLHFVVTIAHWEMDVKSYMCECMQRFHSTGLPWSGPFYSLCSSLTFCVLCK